MDKKIKIELSGSKADWDRVAKKYLSKRSLVSQIENWYTHYIGQAYLKAAKKGLMYLKERPEINLLKTDLWEEVVERGRNILEKIAQLKKGNLNLYAIDISPVLVNKAKKLIKNAIINEGDVRNLPFSNNFFDIILDLSTLDHISQNYHNQVFAEYCRVLKKEGILVLVFFRKSPVLSLINIWAKVRGRKPLIDNQLCFAFAEKEVKEKLKKLFEIKEEYCIGSILLMSLLTRGARKIINKPPYTFMNLILKLEYSRLSKYLFKGFSELSLVIARKK